MIYIRRYNKKESKYRVQLKLSARLPGMVLVHLVTALTLNTACGW